MKKAAMLPILAGTLLLAACGGEAGGDQAAASSAERAPMPPAAPPPSPAAPAVAAAPAEPEAGWWRITVTGYTCGDNCYLEYTTATSTETLTALCEAPTCRPWFDVQAMPDSERGRQYDVRMGSAPQVDGEGTVMDEAFQAVVEMRPVS